MLLFRELTSGANPSTVCILGHTYNGENQDQCVKDDGDDELDGVAEGNMIKKAGPSISDPWLSNTWYPMASNVQDGKHPDSKEAQP